MAITAHDIVSDSPTNNFCTLNPLRLIDGTISDGNLRLVTTDNGQSVVVGSHAMSSGKWYWETLIVSQTGVNTNRPIVGCSKTNSSYSSYLGSNVGDIGYFGYTGDKNINGDGWVSYGDTYTVNNIISVLLDLELGEITFYKDGISQGVAFTGISGEYYPAFSDGNVDNAITFHINFGQDPTFGGAKSPTTTYTDANGLGAFYYEPPTGALALCTANLPDFTPDVTGDVAQDYFKAVIWTGDGSSSISVPVGFTPDLIWMKARNDTKHNNLWDSVRGFAPNKYLISNDIFEEGGTSAQNAGHPELDPNDSSVFLAKAGSASSVWTTTNGTNYVAWCWKAGGSPSATDDGTGVSGSAKLVDTSGAASSTTCKSFKDAAVTAGASNVICPSKMSINQAAGFSIVKYGVVNSVSTVPHGLIKQPEMIIFKNLNQTYNWTVYHKDLTSAAYILILNTTDAELNSSVQFNSTAPNESVFTVGTGGNTNYVTSTSDNIIAYCWHSVEGFSKFGSYTGNGSTDGPFVYCGFRPAFVMVKIVSGDTGSWAMFDVARNTFNVCSKEIAANESGPEYDRTQAYMDILSNGFKLRNADKWHNRSGSPYIFMAFSEQSFKFSNAR